MKTTNNAKGFGATNIKTSNIIKKVTAVFKPAPIVGRNPIDVAAAKTIQPISVQEIKDSTERLLNQRNTTNNGAAISDISAAIIEQQQNAPVNQPISSIAKRSDSVADLINSQIVQTVAEADQQQDASIVFSVDNLIADSEVAEEVYGARDAMVSAITSSQNVYQADPFFVTTIADLHIENNKIKLPLNRLSDLKGFKEEVKYLSFEAYLTAEDPEQLSDVNLLLDARKYRFKIDKEDIEESKIITLDFTNVGETSQKNYLHIIAYYDREQIAKDFFVDVDNIEPYVFKATFTVADVTTTSVEKIPELFFDIEANQNKKDINSYFSNLFASYDIQSKGSIKNKQIVRFGFFFDAINFLKGNSLYPHLFLGTDKSLLDFFIKRPASVGSFGAFEAMSDVFISRKTSVADQYNDRQEEILPNILNKTVLDAPDDLLFVQGSDEDFNSLTYGKYKYTFKFLFLDPAFDILNTIRTNLKTGRDAFIRKGLEEEVLNWRTLLSYFCDSYGYVYRNEDHKNVEANMARYIESNADMSPVVAAFDAFVNSINKMIGEYDTQTSDNSSGKRRTMYIENEFSFEADAERNNLFGLHYGTTPVLRGTGIREHKTYYTNENGNLVYLSKVTTGDSQIMTPETAVPFSAEDDIKYRNIRALLDSYGQAEFESMIGILNQGSGRFDKVLESLMFLKENEISISMPKLDYSTLQESSYTAPTLGENPRQVDNRRLQQLSQADLDVLDKLCEDLAKTKETDKIYSEESILNKHSTSYVKVRLETVKKIQTVAFNRSNKYDLSMTDVPPYILKECMYRDIVGDSTNIRRLYVLKNFEQTTAYREHPVFNDVFIAKNVSDAPNINAALPSRVRR